MTAQAAAVEEGLCKSLISSDDTYAGIAPMLFCKEDHARKYFLVCCFSPASAVMLKWFAEMTATIP